MKVEMSYDEETRVAELTFASGKTLRLSNCDRARADKFLEQYAPEFGRRGLILETPSVEYTRGGNDG